MNVESLFPYVTWICLKVYIKILFSDDVLNWTLSQKGLENIILQQVFYRTISLLFWNISVVLLFFTFVFCLSGSPLPAWLWQNINIFIICWKSISYVKFGVILYKKIYRICFLTDFGSWILRLPYLTFQVYQNVIERISHLYALISGRGKQILK